MTSPRDTLPETFPLLGEKPSFDKRFDLRSFGEPLKALRAVPIRDAGEPLVDLRLFCPTVILNPGCLPFLRETVANKVNQVQASLPEGHTLAIGTGLRTLEMQRGIREHLTKDTKEKHPEWNAATLARMLNRMVAPPDDISPPPHTTGGALDVGIRGPNGEGLDFSSPLEGWAAAPTYNFKISELARSNRLMLIAAMEAAGLTNYVGEWWHWSYGDQGWALRVGSPVAYYGAVEVEDAENQRIPKPPEAEAVDDEEKAI
ncbi:MAG: M15 family metallopeptidase [Janthinobacterium lividum]